MGTILEGWKNLQAISISSVRDTLSGKYHSRDFIHARMEYLRSRVILVGLLFALLTPLWTLMDWWVLPSWPAHLMAIRVLSLGGLILCVWLAFNGHQRITRIYVLSGLVFILPASFYAYMLLTLAGAGHYVVLGYGFIPFLLVATLSIFPFTLLESALVGGALIALQVLASVSSGTWLTMKGLQDLWLLSALLVVALTANYFHLGLLLRLYRQATHDTLTGLLNRGALSRQLGQEAAHEALHILMVDLDHFKQINDTHGHSVGDEVLMRTASLFKAHLGPEDLAARYGGEEFMLILSGRSDEQALNFSRLLLRQVHGQIFFNHDREPFQITASIGLALCQPGQNIEEVLQLADQRLYSAKRAGRNQVVAQD
ncbi:GGDEF domain-containing protein [Alcaligenes pakistanensis]|uniref:diguanylate cyclase n=1 Tax=Alcaligenes pakistanensis TaxID=1482717 RepID=A0A8H9IR51_9BURK|nr:GGDEF domain-containing protein [Alcaligenes pakistanensis]GHC59555.1 GGDEF domain-containing protein [Alcaligenes pakistanensis]HCA15867.1 GGDEF domain-containing protein [Alcaligenes faecalis]